MRAADLFGSVLDRVLPMTRRRPGPSRAWDAPSTWTADWTTPAQGVPVTEDEVGAEDVVAHVVTAAGKHVDVEQGPPDPDVEMTDAVVIEDDPSAGGAGGDAGGSGGPGGSGGSGAEPGDGPDGSDDDPDGRAPGWFTPATGVFATASAAQAAASAGAGGGSGAGHGGGGGGGGGGGDDDNGGGPPDPPDLPATQVAPSDPRRGWPALVALAAAVATVMGFAYVPRIPPVRDSMDRQAVQSTARRFAASWVGDDLQGVAFDQPKPSAAARRDFARTVAERARRISAGLTSSRKDVPTRVTLVGDPVLDPPAADGTRTAHQVADVEWSLDGTPWKYRTTVNLRRRNGLWRIVWSPSTIHRQVTTDGALVTERVQRTRADIVGVDGPLMKTRTAWRVTYTTRTKGYFLPPYGTVRTLSRLTGVDRTWLMGEIRTAPNGSTIQVSTLRSLSPSARRELRTVDGTRVEQVTRPLAPTTTFARSLLGEAMPATQKMAADSKGTVLPGDIVGVTGLQREYDTRLRGTPSARVVLRSMPGKGLLAPVSVKESATPRGTMLADQPESASTTPKPVVLTLDTDVQLAAQRAVDRLRKRAALVAVDTRDGHVLAVASNVNEEWDRALLGAYPPGSTFKMVTTWALTGHGAGAATKLPCPASVTVGGNPFRNVDRAPGGVQPLARQFAESCNTAFAGLGSRVTDRDLVTAATDLGMLDDVAGLGVSAWAGSVPGRSDAATHAAALIGQSTVTVSPLNVAMASASVASGVRRPPLLLVDPAPSGTPARAQTLDASRVATMRSLMCEAVRTGTAQALQKAPGGPVSGKTGTAQFDDTALPQSHGWFTGYQGNVAFAVVVERGGLGARSAVPVALDFLTGLNRGQKARPASSCGSATAALRG